MSEHEIRRDYSNGEVTIHWDASKCIHSGNCARGLPQVFRPRERPWIQLDNATRDEIVAAVAKCPSGALCIKSEE